MITKTIAFAAFIASTSAFVPTPAFKSSSSVLKNSYLDSLGGGSSAPPPPSYSAPAYSPPPAAPAAPAGDYHLPDVDPNPTPTSNEEALEMGWSMGGKAHTKDPTPQENDDPRLTIPEGESFEEYMKRRG
eukprot:CAMPEP_0178953346 /NCGR_PEP_ID=MMETSP0789-20121207/8369_1 /TAXON_ID=3005 /ORGANISM="Rhizosolenia setigera, Strain CCMP 1694" /LENGTH=129 /DNA_ID=CAMNT_0020634597 /DNA_START=95 /DNA_END=484 /DNA_ORIENTATION=-